MKNATVPEPKLFHQLNNPSPMYVDMAQSEKGFPVKFDAVQVVENRELCGVIANYQYKLYNSTLSTSSKRSCQLFCKRKGREKENDLPVYTSASNGTRARICRVPLC
jgi:hypothetical protein